MTLDGIEWALKRRVTVNFVEGAADMVILWVAGNVDPCVLVVDARREMALLIGRLASNYRHERSGLDF